MAGENSTKALEEMCSKLDQTLQADNTRTKGISANFAFVVDGPNGGNWWIEAMDGAGRVHDGSPKEAVATIFMTDETMLKVGLNQLSGAEAFMTGQLKVEGDQAQAMFLGQIFGQ